MCSEKRVKIAALVIFGTQLLSLIFQGSAHAAEPETWKQSRAAAGRVILVFSNLCGLALSIVALVYAFCIKRFNHKAFAITSLALALIQFYFLILAGVMIGFCSQSDLPVPVTLIVISWLIINVLLAFIALLYITSRDLLKKYRSKNKKEESEVIEKKDSDALLERKRKHHVRKNEDGQNSE